MHATIATAALSAMSGTGATVHITEPIPGIPAEGVHIYPTHRFGPARVIVTHWTEDRTIEVNAVTKGPGLALPAVTVGEDNVAAATSAIRAALVALGARG